MEKYQDYLNEFEREFEADDISTEFESYDEREVYDNEYENEFETDDEYETDDEFENDEETDDRAFENDDISNEFESDEELEDNYETDTDREYADKLYEIMTADHESEFEFEQQLNEFMHEVERDYFFKKLWKGVKNIGRSSVFKKIAGFIKKGLPLGDMLKLITKDPRAFIRSFGKKLALMGANFVAPGSGAVLGSVLNQELGKRPTFTRKDAKRVVSVMKKSYDNLGAGLNRLQDPRNLAHVQSQVKQIGKMAVRRAIQNPTRGVGTIGASVSRRTILLKPGSSVVIAHNPYRIIIKTRMKKR